MEVKTEHTLEDVQRMLPLIAKVVARVPDYSLLDFLRFLSAEFAHPSGLYQMWSVWEGEKPLGYAIAMLPVGLNQAAHLLHVESERRDVTKLLQTHVERWAANVGAKALTIITSRSPKAIERRYGFTLQSYVMRKELQNGK